MHLEGFKKIDAHVHSAGVSLCSHVTCRDLVDDKIAEGYDGAVLVNHCQSWYYPPDEHKKFMRKVVEEFRAMKEYASDKNFTVLLGLEVTLERPSYNDWLLYGADEDFLLSSPCLYRLDQKGLYRLCQENGVALVQAHPFRHAGPGDPAFMDGVEINCTPGDAQRAEEVLRLAEECDLIVTCGTDYHGVRREICGGIFVPEEVENARAFGQYLLRTDRTTLFLNDDVVEATVKRRRRMAAP